MHHINSSYIYGFLAFCVFKHLQLLSTLSHMRPGFAQASFESNAEAATWWTWERRLHEWSCKYTKNKICIYIYIYLYQNLHIYICFIYIYMYVYIYLGKLSRPQPRWGPFSGLTKAWSKVRNHLIDWWHEATLQTTTLCCWFTMRRTALSQIQQMRRALGSARVKALCGHTRTGKEVHKAGIKSSLRSRGWSMSSQCTKQFQRLYLYI